MKRLGLWLAVLVLALAPAAARAAQPLAVYVTPSNAAVSDPRTLSYRRTDSPFALLPTPLQPEVVWLRIEPRDVPPGDYAIAFRATSTGRTIYLPRGNGLRAVSPTQTFFVLPHIRTPIYVRATITYDSLPSILPLADAQLNERRWISWSQFFVGFFLAIGLFNLLLFLVLRDPPFLWYTGIMGSMIAIEAVSTPLLRPYVDILGPAFLPLLRVVALWSYFVCIAFFSRSFLRLRRTLPALDVAILFVLGLNLVAIPIEGLLNELWQPFVWLDDVLLVGLLCALLLAGILMYRRGETTARYYIFAFAGAALGILMNDTAERYQYRPQWILYSLQIGIAWEALFLALALADRTHRIAVENEQLGIAKIHAEVLASQDGLTGVPNRRAFDLAFESAWRAAIRLGESLAVVILDVDDFKHFNDTNGHLAGDDVLRRIAHACEECCRRGDDTFARFGGEEFAAVLPRASIADAAAVAERMRKSAESLGILQAGGKPVTISIGVAISRPQLGDSAQDLVAEADAALYRAKAAGKNCAAIA